MPNPPSAAPPSTEPIPPTQGVLDDPAPEVVARFLRPKTAPAPAETGPGPAAPVAAPAAVSATPAAVPVDATLIDTITRIVSEMMETHVRESVTAAVRALAPRLVVSLPPAGMVGADEATDKPADVQVRSRPPRAAPRHD